MLAAQADVGSRMAPLMEQALLSIYHGQQEHAWSKSAVEDVEVALERAGLYRPVRRPPAMCFLDLTGYTRLTEERGDEAAAELATKLATLVRGSSREHGGEPVPGSGSTRGRSSSRRVTTSAGPSTSRRGSPTTQDPARCS
jgi:adenylate cyclase